MRKTKHSVREVVIRKYGLGKSVRIIVEFLELKFLGCRVSYHLLMFKSNRVLECEVFKVMFA